LIVYLVTKRHQYTIQTYLDDWAPTLVAFVAVAPYEGINGFAGLPSATCTFSDLGKLSTAVRRMLGRSLEVGRSVPATGHRGAQEGNVALGQP
jgi:hypothetical protein